MKLSPQIEQRNMKLKAIYQQQELIFLNPSAIDR